MQLIKKNPFVTSIVVILLVCAALLIAAVEVYKAWAVNGFPMTDEKLDAALEKIEKYAVVVTEPDAWDNFRYIKPNDQAIVAYDSNWSYVLDKNGEELYENCGIIEVYGDVVCVSDFENKDDFVTTLSELKKPDGRDKRIGCNYADATDNGKYIAVYNWTGEDDMETVEILNHDFEKVYELSLNDYIPPIWDPDRDTKEGRSFFFTETTEEDGLCYVESTMGTYRYDINLLTGERSDWYEVAEGDMTALEEEEEEEEEPDDKDGWQQLHALGLKPELENTIREFVKVKVLGENYIAVYTHLGATLLRLEDEAYE